MVTNTTHTDYTVYRSDRPNAAHGSVTIIIRITIRHSVIPVIDTEIIEQIGIQTKTTHR